MLGNCFESLVHFLPAPINVLVVNESMNISFFSSCAAVGQEKFKSAKQFERSTVLSFWNEINFHSCFLIMGHGARR